MDYKRRLSIDLPEEEADRLYKLIPWGLKSRLIVHVVKELNDFIEKHGEMAIGAILSGKIKVLDYIKGREEDATTTDGSKS